MGLTQESLARKSGVNKSTISEIENGRFTGSFEIFENLSRAVGLQFELTLKRQSYRIGMKLKIYLRSRIDG